MHMQRRVGRYQWGNQNP